jgi:hypothetical protein
MVVEVYSSLSFGLSLSLLDLGPWAEVVLNAIEVRIMQSDQSQKKTVGAD